MDATNLDTTNVDSMNVDEIRREAAREVAASRSEMDKAAALRDALRCSLHPGADYDQIQRHEATARGHQEKARHWLRMLDFLG